ncbi:hypothetical protein QBC32DRAFT_334175 [Pseudoneurospora amorphoporcata]|uniref:Uncharacterized protein n=1 Tax=Pseudoneurospora amorphoporcata TaxID=241081 RepID=A0AAN6P1X2_9PEZI|nr:hypothetical protein QBC32DRAFT_334175 [Pseudoneurospora amorphoporcata]
MIFSHRAIGIAFFFIVVILTIQLFRLHGVSTIRHDVGSQFPSEASSDVLNITLGVRMRHLLLSTSTFIQIQC